MAWGKDGDIGKEEERDGVTTFSRFSPKLYFSVHCYFQESLYCDSHPPGAGHIKTHPPLGLSPAMVLEEKCLLHLCAQNHMDDQFRFIINIDIFVIPLVDKSSKIKIMPKL